MALARSGFPLIDSCFMWACLVTALLARTSISPLEVGTLRGQLRQQDRDPSRRRFHFQSSRMLYVSLT